MSNSSGIAQKRQRAASAPSSGDAVTTAKGMANQETREKRHEPDDRARRPDGENGEQHKAEQRMRPEHLRRLDPGKPIAVAPLAVPGDRLSEQQRGHEDRLADHGNRTQQKAENGFNEPAEKETRAAAIAFRRTQRRIDKARDFRHQDHQYPEDVEPDRRSRRKLDIRRPNHGGDRREDDEQYECRDADKHLHREQKIELAHGKRGRCNSFMYCRLPWHQRRSRIAKSGSAGGISSQLPSSSGSTRTSKPARRMRIASI
jgi:hypothetical protein